MPLLSDHQPPVNAQNSAQRRPNARPQTHDAGPGAQANASQLAELQQQSHDSVAVQRFSALQRAANASSLVQPLRVLQLVANPIPREGAAGEIGQKARSTAAQPATQVAQKSALRRDQTATPLVASPVLQRYDLDSLDEVDRRLLTRNQRKLYNMLSHVVREYRYAAELGERANHVLSDDPDRARRLRRAKFTIARIFAELTGSTIDIIPDDIFRFLPRRDPARHLTDATAAQYATVIQLELVLLQSLVADLVDNKRVTRTFADFQGDMSDLGAYFKGTSSATAIPIVWYKRTEDYKDIRIPNGDANGHTDFTYPDGPTLNYGGEQFIMRGADPAPFATGKTFENKRNTSDRTTQAKIRQALIAYGFDHAGLDGDHIQDLGFGGYDAAINVWPLDETINRRPYSGWRTSYGINYLKNDGTPATGTPNSMTNKWFVIKSHLDAGAGPVPAEGADPAHKAGTTVV